MLDPAFLIVQGLNGLQLAMLLFLLAVGLSVVFGLMDFINLAHGTLYMLGAYLGFTAVQYTGSFWLALLLAPIGVALIGTVFYGTLLRHMQGRDHMKQVLVTFGLIFIGLDVVSMIWGRFAETVAKPELFQGSVTVLGEIYPAYRLFIIGLGLAVMVLLYFGLEKTRLGAVVRAGVDNREMVSCLGINVDLAFFGVFCLGCFLAGLGGVVAAPVLSVFPGMDMQVLILTLIVVVVGGPGSLKGAVLGSLLIGMAETFGQAFIPDFASAIIYAVMALVLLFRPQGLLPVRSSL
jgi:branched-chain amino acid transport system permease protein